MSLVHVQLMLHATTVPVRFTVNATSDLLVMVQHVTMSMNALAPPAPRPQHVITLSGHISVHAPSGIMATVRPVRIWTSV